MTIQHKGIRRKITDVLDDYGQAHYLQNVRLKRVGEMGRRAGLGKSTMARQAGPVQFMIGAWSSSPFIVNGTGGTVTGQEDPLAYWTAATMRIPIGDAGQPQAPTILSVDGGGGTYTPAYPNPTYTAQIDYDGLSGPLFYQWSIGVPSDIFPALVDPAAETLLTDCSALGPGVFTITLRIECSLNPAFFDEQDASTVTFLP